MSIYASCFLGLTARDQPLHVPLAIHTHSPESLTECHPLTHTVGIMLWGGTLGTHM